MVTALLLTLTLNCKMMPRPPHPPPPPVVVSTRCEGHDLVSRDQWGTERNRRIGSCAPVKLTREPIRFGLTAR